MNGFSIIICTYNPDYEILKRLFDAIDAFDNSSPEYEVIIVDNNSFPAVSENELVKIFQSKYQNSQVVNEKKPGLTSARIAGINQTKYDWIIFFDDDNEPESQYLVESQKCIKQHPEVGAWGPGVIKVNFIGTEVNNFLNSLRPLFQERSLPKTDFDNNIIEGNECYPSGTGLIIKKTILLNYVAAVNNRKLTMSDRSGRSLSSGGDTQMVYIAFRMGYYAGSSPLIKMSHNILPSKVIFLNILKLVYHLNASQVKAYDEVFIENPLPVTKVKMTILVNIFLIFFKRILKHPKQLRYEILDLSKRLGMVKAQIIAGDQNNFLLIKFWEVLIKS